MHETTWDIGASDGKDIFGISNIPESPNGAHVVIVHGLTGNPYEYALKRGADALCGAGYTVHRLALYWSGETRRNMHETTLSLHASDLNDVIAAKCPSVEKLFLIGHSYGGPTIMMANPENVTAVSLWDPTFDAKSMIWEDPDVTSAQTEIGGGRILEEGRISMVFNAEMIAEGLLLDEDKSVSLAENFNGPVQVITAGESVYADQKLSYNSAGNSQNVREFVEGTDHCFYEGNTCDVLLDKTLKWFNQFL